MHRHKISLAGAVVLTCSLLHTCCIDAFSLRQQRLVENEAENKRQSPYFMPSPEMLKALGYIENLKQQTTGEEAVPDYDIEKLRALLRLNPTPTMEDAVQSILGDTRGGRMEDTSQRFKMLLRALQQAEKESKFPLKTPNSQYVFNNRQYPEDDGVAEDFGDYGAYTWPERTRPLKQQQLLFEDEDSRESPYKRTNENVEEQYTPQSLATLESVFKEMGKLTVPSNHKREKLEEEQKMYKDNEDETYRVNNLAYEDVTGGEDWNPVEEKVETQEIEEMKNSKEEIDKSSDEIDEDTKRSSPPKYKDPEDHETEDFSKRLDQYLMRILENNQREEEKRARAERAKDAANSEKRIARPFGSYDMDPRAIYQLIELSRKLQIPPEDLIEMLKSGESKKQDLVLDNPDDQDKIDEKVSQTASYKKDKVGKSHNRRPQDLLPEDLPEDLNTEDILNILGVDNVISQASKYTFKPVNVKNGPGRSSAGGRRGDYAATQPRWLLNNSDRGPSDNGEPADEDELASYLATVLAKYPQIINSKDAKRVAQSSSAEDKVAYGNYEQAMKDYFDQIGASDSASTIKRLSPPPEEDSKNMPHLDEEMLLKMLEYINQETGETEDRDRYAKVVNGM
ncbi:secretogranin-2 [Polypterus senegalus]